MTEEQDERIVMAIERIAEAFDFMAGSLEAIANTAGDFHSRMFPGRKIGADATITTVPSEEELLRKSQGQTGESLKDWTTLNEPEEIGPRERAFLEKQKKEAESVSGPKKV